MYTLLAGDIIFGMCFMILVWGVGGFVVGFVVGKGSESDKWNERMLEVVESETPPPHHDITPPQEETLESKVARGAIGVYRSGKLIDAFWTQMEL